MEVILQTHLRKVEFVNCFLGTNTSANKVKSPETDYSIATGENVDKRYALKQRIRAILLMEQETRGFESQPIC
jgi:hypothetical protein